MKPSLAPTSSSGALLLSGILLLSTSGCAIQPKAQVVPSPTPLTLTRYPYPPSMVQNFMETCVSNRGAEVEAICTCTINKVQDRYTAQQFAKYDAQMIETREPPERMVTLLQSCQTGQAPSQGNAPQGNKKPGRVAR